MTAKVATIENTTYIRLSGNFDFSSQEELNTAFNTALDSKSGTLEVDMEQATFIDSSVIRLFLKLHEAAKQRQKALLIRNCNAHIFEIFTIGGFDKIFNVQ